LKQRSVPKNISNFDLDSEEKLTQFNAIIECDKPNVNLYEFNGKFKIDIREIPITNDNIL
jgi:hypothetical protein